MNTLTRWTVGLLRWSERYTKTDMVYLAKNGSWLSASQFVSALASLLLSILFANLLPKETYGSYKFILAGTSLLGIATLPGMNSALIRAVAQKARGTIYAVLRTRFSWSAIASLLAIGTAGYYRFIEYEPSLAISFLIVAIFLPVMESLSVYDSVLQGEGRFRTSSIWSVASVLIASVTMAITLLITKSLPLIVLAYFVPWTLVRYIFLRKLLKEIGPSEAVLPDTIPYGKHLTLMDIFKVIASHIDKILIFSFFGAVPLAVYTVALAPVSQLKNINQTLADVAFPRFSQRSFAELQTTLFKKVAILVGIMALVILAYVLLAPMLFALLFPQYAESLPYSQVYALSLLSTPGILFIKALTAHKKTKALYIINAGMPLLRIASLIVLVPLFNIWGAVFSYVLIPSCSFVVAAYLFKRDVGAQPTT